MIFPPRSDGRRRTAGTGLACVLSLSIAAALAAPAKAAPWTRTGDAGLRSDIELLESARLVPGITMQWPIAWSGLQARLDEAALAKQPAYLRAAAAFRAQDDQPRPDSGAMAAVELAIRIRH